MKLPITCPLCKPESYDQFIINVNPTNDGVYEITCPKGHEFKIYIPYHHFQKLFENGLDALCDQYYIEALSSFASSYERFMEFFLRVVLKSRGVNAEAFDKAWKNANLSERQLGGFIFVYLKEFGESPNILDQNDYKLRNKVIHNGYFPTIEECIKYGDKVLEFIRPVIKLLRGNKVYENGLLKSIYNEKVINNNEIRIHYFPYSLFAINRSFEKIDEKSVADFLLRRFEERNDEKYEGIIKKVRLLIKEKSKPPTPNKSIIEHAITNILLIEWYNFRYYISSESDINVLTKSHSWKTEDVEQIINHLESINWIRKYNIEGKYTLTGVGGNECEKRGFIQMDKVKKPKTERKSLLKYLYNNCPQKINYKYSKADLAKDYGRDLKDIGVYIADIEELEYVTYYYRLTEKGENIASKIEGNAS